MDQVADGLGGAIGRTRLWRLTFTDITNPNLGGTIDLLIDGQIVGGQKVDMFDNLTVNEKSGHILIQEDVVGAAHNGKMWEYDPATFTGTTNSGSLKMIVKHDPARFGDRVNPVTTAATAPFNNDEETSGVIDITSIMAGGLLLDALSANASLANLSGTTTVNSPLSSPTSWSPAALWPPAPRRVSRCNSSTRPTSALPTPRGC